MSIFKKVKDNIMTSEDNSYKPYNLVVTKCKGELHKKECHCECHNPRMIMMHMIECCYQEKCELCNQMINVK